MNDAEVDWLKGEYAAGRIDLDEFERRVARLLANESGEVYRVRVDARFPQLQNSHAVDSLLKESYT